MELKNNKNIINEEDEVGKIVIMNTKHYCKMIYDHINNNQIYKNTNSTCDNNVTNEMKWRLAQVSECFNQARNRLLNEFLSVKKLFQWSPENS